MITMMSQKKANVRLHMFVRKQSRHKNNNCGRKSLVVLLLFFQIILIHLLGIPVVNGQHEQEDNDEQRICSGGGGSGGSGGSSSCLIKEEEAETVTNDTTKNKSSSTTSSSAGSMNDASTKSSKQPKSQQRQKISLSLSSSSSSSSSSASTSSSSEQQCADDHDTCSYWASLGHCEAMQTFMYRSCRKSCQLCIDTSSSTTTAKTTANDKNKDKTSSSSSSSVKNLVSKWGKTQYIPSVTSAATTANKTANTITNENQQQQHLLLLRDKIETIIQKTNEYMLNVVYNDNNHYNNNINSNNNKHNNNTATTTTALDYYYTDEIRRTCRNRETNCSLWAAQGECQNNPNYMKQYCAPACRSCHYLDIHQRCRSTDKTNGSLIWKPGDLNTMFQRILQSNSYHNNYDDDDDDDNPQQRKPKITIHSKPSYINFHKNSNIKDKHDKNNKNNNDNHTQQQPQQPKDGPWVITLDNFLTDQECDRLIQLGYAVGYGQSYQVGSSSSVSTISQNKVQNNFRTSTNAWCNTDACYKDTIVQDTILPKLYHLTLIPETHSEYLQLLRYTTNQYYSSHHDYIPEQAQYLPHVRIFTLYLYLSDVQQGGETDFPYLNITVQPKKGKAVIWPNVYNDYPDRADHRTTHQALPVKKGIKFGANAWYHARDFKTPYQNGCVG